MAARMAALVTAVGGVVLVVVAAVLAFRPHDVVVDGKPESCGPAFSWIGPADPPRGGTASEDYRAWAACKKHMTPYAGASLVGTVAGALLIAGGTTGLVILAVLSADRRRLAARR